MECGEWREGEKEEVVRGEESVEHREASRERAVEGSMWGKICRRNWVEESRERREEKG